MNSRRDFLDFIKPEVLFLFAVLFLLVTFLFVTMIYFQMYQKKKLFFGREKINEQLNIWISYALIEETAVKVKVPAWLRHYFRREEHRRHIIDTLINVRKSLSGAASDNITALYAQLGLRNDSDKRLKSTKWHECARGIYELYMMGQSDALPEIAKFTNSKNETVRMEAQTATIGFRGFDGLFFLNTLTQPINNWQQMKLLEQLARVDVREMPQLPMWLVSSNEYVCLFALKLAEIFQQYNVHDLVVGCLNTEKESIRNQAVKTLGKIAIADTARILRSQYKRETKANKKVILRQLSVIGFDDDMPFMVSQFRHEDDGIKLEAGRAIVRNSSEGRTILRELSLNDDVLESICKQIEYELSK